MADEANSTGPVKPAEEKHLIHGAKMKSTKQEERLNKNDLRCLWAVVLLLVLALLISVLVIAGCAVLAYQKLSAVTPKRLAEYDTFQSTKYSSCHQLHMSGVKTSGLYYIDKEISTSKVYCDMTTDGGGWTLVASINIKDPAERCSYSDFWSYQGSNTVMVTGSENWKNRNTTGSVSFAAFDDYKSSAYFDLKASDVLISHVPKNTAVRNYDRASFFKYHTSNNFLDDFGSSLQTFFSDFAKLESLSNVGVDKEVLQIIRANQSLPSLVSNFYNYTYDGGANYIETGGNNMLESGNRVYYSINDEPYVLMNYDQTYTDFVSYHISSATIQPFLALASISAFDGYPRRFRMKVAHGSTDKNQYRKYHYFNFMHKRRYISGKGYFKSSTASNQSVICTIFFQIKKGNDGTPSAEVYYTKGSNFEMVSSIKNPINALIGYTLLAKYAGTSGESITYAEIEKVMKRIVDFTLASSVDIRDLRPRNHFVFPVNFVKGNLTYSNQEVSSGHLQFRAYDFYGAPYAMCPGVRVNNADPSLYCIGSAGTSSWSQQGRCGDFSDWSSLRDHVFVNRSTSRSFVNDVKSTIMIFTRNHEENPV